MSLWLTDLADVLRAGGLTVIEAPGWKTRGWKTPYSTPDGGLRALTGGLVHHTGTPSKIKGDYPTWDTIIGGRSDVPGPLSQLGLGKSGAWYVFAAGRANHSGAVDDIRFSNPQCLGVEAEHDGVTPWTVRQYLSYVTGCAVLSKHYRIPWRGHKEAAVPYGRKPDPIFDMSVFRKDLGAPVQPPEVDMSYTTTDRAEARLALAAIGRIEVKVNGILKSVGELPETVLDEGEVARLVLATLTPEEIAKAVPEGIAGSVADEIARRLGVA